MQLHPKRGDLRAVYADLLVKYSGIDEAVSVLERGLETIDKQRARNHLLSRLIYMEERRGDVEKAQEWRNKLE